MGVTELRKHVQSVQAELQATRQVAQKTNEQLRVLMQHAGMKEVPPNRSLETSGMYGACLRNGPVVRSSSISSQESPLHVLHRVSYAHSPAAERSPVQLPRARSLESVGRRRMYPLSSRTPVKPQSNLQTPEKLAPKRLSLAAPQPRVADVPVRMCTSDQLMQVAKQRPLWLQKSADRRPPKTARPQLCH